MRRLLRNVIDFGDGKLTPEALSSNFLRLVDSPIEWGNPNDAKLFQVVKEFFSDTCGSLPSEQVLRDFCEGRNEVELGERLNDIKTAPVYTYKNFEHVLNQLVEDQTALKFQMLLKDTNEIVKKGLTVPDGRTKKTLRGAMDALAHFNSKVSDVFPPVRGAAVTEGNLRDDTTAGWDDYQASKSDKSKAYGRLTGLNSIDKTCHGLKPGELWVHGAFTGGLKTTFALNWSYNQVTRYKGNVLYVSLEMPYVQIRRLVHTLHSGHKKYRDAGIPTLDYRKVRDGELGDEEERHYQAVLEDFNTNPLHCQFNVWSPDRDVTMNDIRTKAETMQRDSDVSLIVIDHSGLLADTNTKDDYLIRYNARLREAKRLALTFNAGQGVPILMLHQLNREGHKEATKSGGKHALGALSYANEAERSADYVTTSFVDDEHRANNTAQFNNAKNRDNPCFPSFNVQVDWKCRLLHETIGPRTGSGVMVDDGTDLGAL